MNIFKLPTLLMLSLLYLNQGAAQTDWEVEKESNGITIETRVTDITPIKEFRASTTINAPLASVVATLTDVEHHPDWMNDISYAERLSENPEVLHYNIRTPFPMKDRYVVVNVETVSGDSTWRLEMQSSEATPTEIEDHVHVPIVRGYWQFTKIDASTTAVQYQFLSDPGLQMPDWLINAFIVNNPYKTLRNLKKRLE